MSAVHRPKAEIAQAREAYGKRLRHWIVETKRTMTSLSVELGVSSSATVQRWVSGVASPSEEHAAVLAEMGGPRP